MQFAIWHALPLFPHRNIGVLNFHSYLKTIKANFHLLHSEMEQPNALKYFLHVDSRDLFRF
jgi:hypothetical protein